MITTIITIGLIGYIVLILGLAVLSLIVSIWLKDWDMFTRDLGAFIILNAALAFGFSIGAFIFGNILNFMTDGYFAINICDPNKAGLVLLAISFVLYIIGSAFKNDNKNKEAQKKFEESRKHKYITLKTGQRVQLY